MQTINLIAVMVAAILVISIKNTFKLKKMANEIEDLTGEVLETKGIMKSAAVLIGGFAEALRNAGTDPVKIKALQTSLDEGSTELAAAIAANPLPGEVVEPPVEPPVE